MEFRSLVETVEEVAGYGVWRGEGDVFEEAIENLECFTLDSDALGVDQEELAAVVNDAIDAWLQDAATDGSGRPGTVYVWYDDQAFQLRMSFISGHLADLPFDAPLEFTQSVSDVLKLFVARTPWVQAQPLPVFARQVGGAEGKE
ncbi:hypothetical protein ACIA8O_30985 [Kitasatospora sp. NPDC051853]|uniref:hypothetical protein n=1 Tax=Kitasatospora sp. NPDC051853 TaxID=3364058 RepID=UPI003790CC91